MKIYASALIEARGSRFSELDLIGKGSFEDGSKGQNDDSDYPTTPTSRLELQEKTFRAAHKDSELNLAEGKGKFAERRAGLSNKNLRQGQDRKTRRNYRL